ncbi:MAG: zinc-dependent alcohol dehydrogenase family protein, partial [Gammaproteobacteria bacterium]|nr:zinc-dependent alcohol dehydrogenase family protein [Gammaproteobacteria bacterium]
INPPTAALMLSEFVDLQEGDWVIQNAANSGVGAYLIALAKRKGLKTVNVVRREALIKPLLAQGADVVLVDGVVDGKDLAERVKQATGGADIKLGIDAVAGSATGRMGDALCNGATLVNYGGMSGEPCAISPLSVIFKDINLRGFWLARWFQTASPEQQKALFGELTTLVAQGILSAPVHASYPVKDIKEAVKVASSGSRNGKVVVVGDALL